MSQANRLLHLIAVVIRLDLVIRGFAVVGIALLPACQSFSEAGTTTPISVDSVISTPYDTGDAPVTVTPSPPAPAIDTPTAPATATLVKPTEPVRVEPWFTVLNPLSFDVLPAQIWHVMDGSAEMVYSTQPIRATDPDLPTDVRAQLEAATANPDGMVFSVGLNALSLSHSRTQMAWLQTYGWCQNPLEERGCIAFTYLKVAEVTPFKVVVEQRIDDADGYELNWSPDDQLVALRRNPEASNAQGEVQAPTLALVDHMTGDVIGAGPAYTASWFGRGRTLVRLSDQGLEMIPDLPPSGTVRSYPKAVFYGIQAMACSPSSPVVALAADTQEDADHHRRPIYLLDLDSAFESVLLNRVGELTAFESPSWSYDGRYLAANAAQTSDDNPISTVVVTAKGELVGEFPALVEDPLEISFVWSGSQPMILRKVYSTAGITVDVLNLASGLSSRLTIPEEIQRLLDDNNYDMSAITW